jgi:hypothetical protein
MTVANRPAEFGHMVPLHIAMAASGENQRRFVALPRRRFTGREFGEEGGADGNDENDTGHHAANHDRARCWTQAVRSRSGVFTGRSISRRTITQRKLALL